MYICPKCKESLLQHENRYICKENHSFDIASAGYVNLILGNKPFHGDNKAMVNARRRFLRGGKYSIIIDTLTKLIKDLSPEHKVIVDAGCGEGYYTSALKANIPKSEIYAFDVSKDAVILAAKADKSINYSVASVNNVPLCDSCSNIVLSLFAPLCEEEFNRVLKPGGILITVSPSPDHLFSLKSEIYETPYKNPPSTFLPAILTKADETTVSDTITLETNEEIMDLFTMTPYCYNTGKDGRDKVAKLQNLKTEIGFVFGIYKKQL